MESIVITTSDMVEKFAMTTFGKTAEEISGKEFSKILKAQKLP